MSQNFLNLRRLWQGLFGAVALMVLLLTPLHVFETAGGIEKSAMLRLAAETIRPLYALPSSLWQDARAFFVRKEKTQKIVVAHVTRETPLPQKTISAQRHVKTDLPLTNAEEKVAREIFSMIENGHINEAKKAIENLDDHILMPYLQAALYLSPRYTDVSFGDMHAWLTAYADVPLAKAIYEKADKMRGFGGAKLPTPRWRTGLSGNIEMASGALPAEWKKSRTLSVVAALQQKKTQDQDNQEGQEGDDVAPHSINLSQAEDHMRKGEMAEAANLLAPLTEAAPQSAESAYGFWLKGLVSWSLGDKDAAFDDFSAAANTDGLSAATRAAAAFWAARSAEALGHHSEARHYLTLAAETPRSFYGLLAHQRLGQMPDYQWALPAYTQKHMAALMAHPAGARALALLQIGNMDFAERELRGIQPRGDSVLREALVAISAATPLPSLALQVAGASFRANTGFDSALYPLLPPTLTQSLVSDPALVMAVARQESRFDAAAKSPRGATGLMQIMPDTAERLMAGSAARLTEPALNVKLGDMYLKKMADMKGIDGQLIYAIAAYNCGPGKLLELKAREDVHGNDPLLFIETLPIRETRHYVQKVLMNYWAYQVRLGGSLASARTLAEGRMPRFEPASRLASK